MQRTKLYIGRHLYVSHTYMITAHLSSAHCQLALVPSLLFVLLLKVIHI